MAWDGTTLAGDTLAVIGDNLKSHARKIFLLPDGRLYGGSGDRQDVLAVRDWLTEGGDKPKVHESFSGILIGKAGQCARLEDSLVPLPIEEPFHAIGSGRDFAIAAMVLGKSAVEAVELAARFDAWTGGLIDALCVLYGTKETTDGTAVRPYRVLD